jgi:hypothetical protein
MNAISHWEVSYLRPYPTAPGQRSAQSALTLEQAEKIKDFYQSMGAVDVKVQRIK